MNESVIFIRTAFIHLCLHLYIYLYDVAYRSNDLFRSLVLNFFASYSTTGIVFLFFATSS